MRTHQASATAHLIAASTVALSQQAQVGWLVPERAAALSAWFAATQPANFLSVRLAPVLERLTVPGIKLHYALRKRYLEEVVRDFLGGGGAQVVVLGAGFDTLALRLHAEFPAAQFLEVDHPATQHAKTDALAARHYDTPNLRFIPLDLTQNTLAATLNSHAGYSATARTLFVAEGLLMYFAPADVDALFRFIGGTNSRFAFTFMALRDDGRIAFHNGTVLVDWWLRWRGEPFLWGLWADELGGFVRERGLRLDALADAATLRQRYLAPRKLEHLALAVGECIGVAEAMSGIPSG